MNELTSVICLSEATRNYDFDMDKETCIDWIATWAIWEFQKLYGLFQETIRLNERESTLPKWQFNQEVDDIIRRVMCATVKYGAVLQIVHVEADLGSTTVPYISSVLNERLEEATDNNYSVVQEMGFEVLESQIGKEVIPVTMYF